MTHEQQDGVTNVGPGMGDNVILPNSSEPAPGPLERASVISPEAAFVLDAFEDHRRPLASFAYGMTRDREAADDLVQESFLRLVKEMNGGRAPDNVGAWLFRVCANLATSRGRRMNVAQRFLRVVRIHDEPPADVEILRREENETLLAGLATLPPDGRAALLMAAQGFSGREIAEALGRTEVATRTMMFRAREKLRVYLVREGVRS
ncbi:MAG TPA: RNA polymerase sigma factor [Candidatus Limnocylindrales bacterium]|jgi:RNA polymerase sigma-70 factor (ECF subfamily)|nr:RNA polymerase sigma factor [Candidatus Limnocylindrales bacterium]